MSYTKGTWEIVPTEGANRSEYPQYVVSRFDTGGVRGIALIRGAWLSESDANAHLIAAAPEMYEALKLWHKHQAGMRGHFCAECWAVLEDAFAKAAKAKGKK